MTQPLSRRVFLETCAAGGMVLAGGLPLRTLEAAQQAGWPPMPPVTIHVVYVGLGGAWRKGGGHRPSRDEAFGHPVQARNRNVPSHAVRDHACPSCAGNERALDEDGLPGIRPLAGRGVVEPGRLGTDIRQYLFL